MDRRVKIIVNGTKDSCATTSKHSDPKNTDGATISMLMRYILALHMNLEEANQFLLYCSKALSPCSKTDRVYTYIIKNRIYDKDAVNKICKENKIKEILTTDYKSEIDK